MSTLLEQAASEQVLLFMSEINLAEIFYTIARDRGMHAAERLVQQLSLMPIQMVATREGEAILSGRIKAQWRISLADCFCIVLAQRLDATVLTGDPDFLRAGLENIIHVEWLGA